MKVISLILLAFISSAFSQDELGRELGKRCETVEVKKMIGSTGSCRVLVVPKPAKKKFVCSGNVGAMKFLVTFDPQKFESLNVKASGTQSFDLDFESKASVFNLAMLIKRADETDAVAVSDSDLMEVSSDVLNILLEDNKGVKTARIQLSTQSGNAIALDNVQCQ